MEIYLVGWKLVLKKLERKPCPDKRQEKGSLCFKRGVRIDRAVKLLFNTN
ncbi:MAG: hypothetical protein Q9M89_01150 [Persephonella sp.]|nr:hypothetical protein [Persephonella sp.]